MTLWCPPYDLVVAPSELVVPPYALVVPPYDLVVPPYRSHGNIVYQLASAKCLKSCVQLN